MTVTAAASGAYQLSVNCPARMPSPVSDVTLIGMMAFWPWITLSVPALMPMPRTSTLPLVVALCAAASVAVTVTAPGATPVSRPELEMVAIALFEVVHATGFVTLPPAVNCSVCPRTISPDVGETLICGVTPTLMLPLASVAAGAPSLNTKLASASPV